MNMSLNEEQTLLLKIFLVIGLCNSSVNCSFCSTATPLPLDNWVFDNLISVDELFVKTLRRFATCLSVNNNLWRKLVSS